MLSYAIAQVVSRWLPTLAAAWFDHKSGHVGFVVAKVALGQVFSEYFRFPCQFSFHQIPHSHCHHPPANLPGLQNRPNSGQHTKWTQSHQLKEIKKKVQVCTGPIHIKSEIMEQLSVRSRWMGLPQCLFNALCAKNIRTNCHLKITCYKLYPLSFSTSYSKSPILRIYLSTCYTHPFQCNIIPSFGTVLLDTMQEVLSTPDRSQLTPICTSINLQNTHFQQVPRSRMCGSTYPLPHTSSWHNA
jgi:hypothetical protein